MNRAAAITEKSRQKMNVKVIHRLAAHRALVDADRKAVGAKDSRQTLGHLLHGEEYRPHFGRREVSDRSTVDSRDHHGVPGGAGAYIQKRDGVAVVVYDFGGYLPCGDPAEKALGYCLFLCGGHDPYELRNLRLISSTSLSSATVSCKLFFRFRTMIFPSKISRWPKISASSAPSRSAILSCAFKDSLPSDSTTGIPADRSDSMMRSDFFFACSPTWIRNTFFWFFCGSFTSWAFIT